MSKQLNGRKVAFLATDGVEQVELTAPWNARRQAGADVTLGGQGGAARSEAPHQQKAG